MSFFIKSNKRRHNSEFKKSDKNKSESKLSKDEVDSDSENEFDSGIIGDVESEDENETSQEKRLRLAKVYLQEIESAERERLEDKESLDQNAITNRLKEDYLKQTGRYRSAVADKYSGYCQDKLTLLKCKQCKRPVTCLCVSSDNKYIFSGSKDGCVIKWSLDELKKIDCIPFKKKNFVNAIKESVNGHTSTISCIAITDDFKFLAVGEESNDIIVWNPETLAHIGTLKGHKNHLTSLVFRSNTHQLYSCSKDRSVKIWSMDDMSYLETFFGHQDAITSMDALSKERVLTAGGIDKTIRVWKIGEESQLIFVDTGNVDCIKFVDDEHFISGGDSGKLNMWKDTKKKSISSVLNAHGCNSLNGKPNWICSVAALVNTDLVASGSNDGFIRLWKTQGANRSLKPLFTVPVKGFVNSLKFTSNGEYLVAGIGQEHRLGRWQTIKDAKNGILIIPLDKLT